MPARKTKEQRAAAGTPFADKAGTLTVTAQQSRFHTEMDEDNNLKEVKSLQIVGFLRTPLLTSLPDRREGPEHLHRQPRAYFPRELSTPTRSTLCPPWPQWCWEVDVAQSYWG
jgi:hypothetical protein